MTKPSIESRLVDIAKDEKFFAHAIGRRAFLKTCAAAGVSLTGIAGVGALLAGCGEEATTTTAGATTTAAGATTTTAGATTTTAGVTTTAAATSTTLKEYTKGLMGLSVTTLNDTTFTQERDVIKQFCAKLGLDMDLFEHNGDGQRAISYPGSLAARGGQMMIGIMCYDATVPGLMAEADRLKVYTANDWYTPSWYTPALHKYWVQWIVPPAEAIAYAVSKAVMAEMGGEGMLVHVPGSVGVSADTSRTAGLMRALKEFPNVEYYKTAPGNWVGDAAAKAFNDALPQVGKDFKGCIAQNDSSMAGVIGAMDALGITGKICGSYDGNKLNMQYILQGKQHFDGCGFQTTQICHSAIAVFDAVNGYQRPQAASMLYNEGVLATKDNAQQIIDIFYESKEDLMDYPLMSRVLHPDDWDPQAGITPMNPYAQWAGEPQDAVKLDPSWDSALTADFEKVKQAYKDHWKKGPTFAWKDTSIFESANNTGDFRG